MNIESIINHAKIILRNANISSYALDARILFEHCFEMTHEQIIMHSKREILEDKPYNLFLNLVNKRAKYYPIAQLIGKKEFYGLEFLVTKDTLIPRPDSETIIEAILEYYNNPEKSLRILDLGTGTGCLLITMLKLFSKSTGVGVDLSKDALSVARANASIYSLNNRAEFILSNWGEKLNDKFDLIISNPPYISRPQIHALSLEVREHEPRMALDGGESGYDCYLEIISSIDRIIKEDTIIGFEIGYMQENKITEILSNYDFRVIALKKDLNKINRVILAKKNNII